MNNPLISINIPTYNSERTLELCLKSILKQKYKKYEIIIIDSNSKDKTVQIAKKYKCKMINYPGKLLGARYEGVKKSEGEYVLLLDSDQILSTNSIKDSVFLFKEKDLLALEEHVYNPKSWIEKLFEMDRRLIHNVQDLSPETGIILPRFYKKETLLKAFSNIPEKIRYSVAGQDHAIIYYEAYKISKKIGIVRDAVFHIEPNSLRIIWKKFYRWGKTSKDLQKIEEYKDLLSKKERFRKGLFSRGNFKNSLGSITLLIIKGVPYKLGYWFGR